MSLGVKNTIPTKTGFKKVFLKPDIELRGGGFVLLGKENELDNPRLGISIKKNDYKLAVHRNYLKRKVRSSFQNFIGSLPLCDFVVLIVAKGNYKYKKIEIDENLNLLWKQCIGNRK